MDVELSIIAMENGLFTLDVLYLLNIVIFHSNQLVKTRGYPVDINYLLHINNGLVFTYIPIYIYIPIDIPLYIGYILECMGFTY